MKFKLRPWNMQDLDALVKYANNPKIAANMTNQFPFPYTRESGAKFIEMATSSDPAYILCIEVNGEAAGGIGVHSQEDVMSKNMELGYWLSEDYWGRGIVTEAVAQMIPYAFSNWGVERIFARPYGPNTASQRILEKNGFRREGVFKKAIFKNDEFLNLHIYAILKEDYLG